MKAIATQSITIVFSKGIPSKKNGKQWLKRGRRRYLVPSPEYTAWEGAEINRVRALHGQPKLDRYSLQIAIFFPNNSVRDTDNLLTSVQDFLIKAGIIKDDRWQYMITPPVICQPEVDEISPRVEVTIRY